MIKELKPCPYCGSKAIITAEGYCSCSNNNCPSDCVILSIDDWQSRPVEDALRKQLEESEADKHILKLEIEIVKEICSMYGKQIPAPCPGNLIDLAKYILAKLAEIELIGKDKSE